MRTLVAIDGSDDAKAVAWLGRMPRPAENVLVLTAVRPPRVLADADSAQAIRSAVVGEARRLLDDAASALGAVARRELVEGDPRATIVDAAHEWGANLIVMGARGIGGVRRLLLGASPRPC